MSVWYRPCKVCQRPCPLFFDPDDFTSHGPLCSKECKKIAKEYMMWCMREEGSFGEMYATVLPPCAREGDEKDWWKERHKSCTGTHHVNGEHFIRCTCECHDTKAEHR